MKGCKDFFFLICLLCCVCFFGRSAWPGKGFGVGGGVQNAIPWGFDLKLDSILTTEAGSTFFSTKREGFGGMDDVKKGARRFFFWGGKGGAVGDLGGVERLLCALEGLFSGLA